MTTSKLQELLASPPHTTPGAWDRMLEELDPDDALVLEAAMRDPRTPTVHVIRALRAAGARVGGGTVYEVRRSYLRGER